MAEKKVVKKEKVGESQTECKDRLCPTHGSHKLRLRGRVFEGEIIRKLNDRVTIQFERMIKVHKYERYEKRRTKLHARLPGCMKSNVSVGDRIQISETRPISKTIHFIVTKIIKQGDQNEGDK